MIKNLVILAIGLSMAMTCQGQHNKELYRSYTIDVGLEDDKMTISYEIDLQSDSLGLRRYTTSNKDSFLLLLSKDLNALPDNRNSVLIYIHGLWGGQRQILSMATDELRHRFVDAEDTDIGRIISIRWPGNSPIYVEAKGNAHQLAPNLAPELLDLCRYLNQNHDDPDIMVHSLGSVFFGLMYDHMDVQPTDRVVDQLLICAPDLEVDVFDKAGMLTSLPELCNGITTYYSNKDVTLSISEKLNERPRLGVGGPQPNRVVSSIVSYVDVSDISDEEDFALRFSGHSYYRSSPRITQDMLLSMQGKVTSDGIIIGREKVGQDVYRLTSLD